MPNYGGRGHPDYNSTVNQPFWGHRWAPFLGGYDLTNITIGGENGTIDGSGPFWWARHLAKLEKYTRPPLFSCLRCTDMLLEDATFKNSAFWTIYPVLGRRLTARCIYVLAPDGPNTDGFDPDSTSDVLFIDSYVSNGDDMVAIKAGWDCAGYDAPNAAPSDNIVIRNVTQYGGGGGLSFGSEMSGGISNVMIEDLRLLHGSYGIEIKTGTTRGGYIKNVSMNNIEIVGTTKEAICIDGFYVSQQPALTLRCCQRSGWLTGVRTSRQGVENTWCPQPAKRVPSVAGNIQITNVVVRNANLSVHFHGALDVPATRVRLQNVSFVCDGVIPEHCSASHYGNCCLEAEYFGGVEFTAEGITPPRAIPEYRARRAKPQQGAAGVPAALP